MDADKCSIADLFQQARRHVVPLYQRAYVWKKEEQWLPLWEDVLELVQLLVEERPAPAHFLGAVVRAHAPTSGLRLDSWLVIDGQQRLTTLQILIAALRDRVALFAKVAPAQVADNVKELEHQLRGFTVNPGVVKHEFERFKVWPTNADREAFTSVLGAKSREALDKLFPPQFDGKKRRERLPDARRVVEAYRFFGDSIETTITDLGRGDDEQIARVLEALVAALGRLMVVVIDLDEDDDAQEIFETLNFRGQPLQASDLVKNFIFGRAAVAKLDPEALYATYWQHFDAEADGDVFWKRVLTQGRLSRPIFDTFIEHYLQCKATDAVTSRHLYQSFKSWWESPGQRDVETELRELERHAAVYRTFHEPGALRPKAPRLSTFLERIQALDTTTVYPLLLLLLADYQLPAAQRDEALTLLESYLVRRAVVGTSTRNLNRVFAALVRDLRRGGEASPSAIRERLKQFKGVDEWPSDEKFEAGWLRDPIYKRMKSRGIQMLLRALHDSHVGPRQEAVTVPSDLTVEHVMPQSWEAHWSPPASPATAEEDAVSRRDRLIHTIGNLTLLTNALNPEASNKPFAQKQDAFTKSVLVLNRYFDRIDAWDEDAIVARSAALFEHAKRIWPA